MGRAGEAPRAHHRQRRPKLRAMQSHLRACLGVRSVRVTAESQRARASSRDALA
jgi:hypothetical protein